MSNEKGLKYKIKKVKEDPILSVSTSPNFNYLSNSDAKIILLDADDKIIQYIYSNLRKIYSASIKPSISRNKKTMIAYISSCADKNNLILSLLISQSEKDYALFRKKNE